RLPGLPFLRDPRQRRRDRQEGLRVGIEGLEDRDREEEDPQRGILDPEAGLREHDREEEAEEPLPEEQLHPEEPGDVRARREEPERPEREHVVDARAASLEQRVPERGAPGFVERSVRDVARQDHPREPERDDEDRDEYGR